MTVEQFCTKHPKLYHMATGDALDQIKKHGLLSTRAILDLVGATEQRKSELLSRRRPEMITLTDPALGSFTLRDQKPMSDSALGKCLQGISVPEWYELLNERVFLWATENRLHRMSGAYKKTDRLILTVDSWKLMEKHSDAVHLSTINSGSTLYVPVPRGKATFVRLSDFPTSKGTKEIAEVTIMHSIPDFKDFITETASWGANE